LPYGVLECFVDLHAHIIYRMQLRSIVFFE
jgi:hypothetical protein